VIRDDLEHHRVRVREELDHAYRATVTAAVHAHFRLAALHMNRVDELVRADRQRATAERNAAAAIKLDGAKQELMEACG
jgi:hypothetical protein